MRKSRQYGIRILILASYLILPGALLEYVMFQRIIAIPIIAFPLVLLMLLIKNEAGKRLFSVHKLRRIGPFYYFPLELADEA